MISSLRSLSCFSSSIARIGNIDPAVNVGAASRPKNAGAAEAVWCDGSLQMQRLIVLRVHGIDGKFIPGDSERHRRIRLQNSTQYLAVIDGRADTIHDLVQLEHAFRGGQRRSPKPQRVPILRAR